MNTLPTYFPMSDQHRWMLAASPLIQSIFSEMRPLLCDLFGPNLRIDYAIPLIVSDGPHIIAEAFLPGALCMELSRFKPDLPGWDGACISLTIHTTIEASQRQGALQALMDRYLNVHPAKNALMVRIECMNAMGAKV